MTNAILSALANGAVVSALLATAVTIGLALVPRRVLHAAARYAVWWTVLLAAMLLPLGYFPAPARKPALAAAVHAVATGAVAANPSVMAPTPIAPIAPAPIRSALPRFPLIFPAGAWTRWVLAVWAAVSGLLLLRLALSLALLSGRKRGAEPVPELAQHGIPVLRSSRISAPVLAGIRRPAILIPERLFGQLTREELAQIVLHEAAHLERRDDYALLAQRFLEALFPFHPVVLFAARRIDLERELACDEMVVDRLGAPRSYAECLLRVVEICRGARVSVAATGVIGERSQLAHRIDRLLRYQPQTGGRNIRALAAIAAVLALVFVATHAPRALAFTAPPQPPAVPAPVAAPVPAATPLPHSAVLPQPAPPPAPQTPAPVVLPVTVLDGMRRYVTGLTRENFRVLEDGVEQPISSVSEEDAPLSVRILVDVSGSMRDKQTMVDAAITSLVEFANPADDFLVTAFSEQSWNVGDFANDPVAILMALHQFVARGGTAMRDAIAGLYKGDPYLKARYTEHLIVVISDGVDNASSTRSDELASLDPPLWAITLQSPGDGRPDQRRWLTGATEGSHGREFVAASPEEAANAAARIARQPRYVVQFTPNNPVADGKYRRIRVDIVGLPDAPQFTVRTRSGYYANGH